MSIKTIHLFLFLTLIKYDWSMHVKLNGLKICNQMDNAFIKFDSIKKNKNFIIYYQYADDFCSKCDMVQIINSSEIQENKQISIDSYYSYSFKVIDSKKSRALCDTFIYFQILNYI